jgi:hypothetical protein
LVDRQKFDKKLKFRVGNPEGPKKAEKLPKYQLHNSAGKNWLGVPPPFLGDRKSCQYLPIKYQLLRYQITQSGEPEQNVTLVGKKCHKKSDRASQDLMPYKECYDKTVMS